MKNILLIITIGIIIYIVPSYALSTIVSNTINSKVDVYKSYNYTVQRMGLYPKEGDLLDYFTMRLTLSILNTHLVNINFKIVF